MAVGRCPETYDQIWFGTIDGHKPLDNVGFGTGLRPNSEKTTVLADPRSVARGVLTESPSFFAGLGLGVGGSMCGPCLVLCCSVGSTVAAEAAAAHQAVIPH